MVLSTRHCHDRCRSPGSDTETHRDLL